MTHDRVAVVIASVLGISGAFASPWIARLPRTCPVDIDVDDLEKTARECCFFTCRLAPLSRPRAGTAGIWVNAIPPPGSATTTVSDGDRDDVLGASPARVLGGSPVGL